MIRMSLGDLDLNTGTPDSNGNLWYVTDWDGWDSPAIRQSFGDMTSRHGQLTLESMYSSRTISLSGVCKPAGGETGLWLAYNDLLAYCSNLVETRDFVVYENVPKKLGVLRAGNPKVSINGGHFTFDIPLIAPDPFKYAVDDQSVAISAGSVGNIECVGTFQTYPTFRTTALTCIMQRTQSSETFHAVSTTSGTHVYDSLRRTAYVGTQNTYADVKAGSVWWALQPGANTIRNNSPSGVTTVTYRDAWI